MKYFPKQLSNNPIEIDTKLGIKSSLEHPRATLAFAILLWEASDNKADIDYSSEYENNNKKAIKFKNTHSENFYKYYQNIIEKLGIDRKSVV